LNPRKKRKGKKDDESLNIDSLLPQLIIEKLKSSLKKTVAQKGYCKISLSILKKILIACLFL